MAENLAYTPLFSRHQPGGVYTIAGIDSVPGKAWFVDASATLAGNAAGKGRNPNTPFSTLAYAFSSDSVAAGDVVYLMPGHTESIAAAGGITMDIAGVRVVGLGDGAKRPTFTWTAADATWLITAASCAVDNILCLVSSAIDVVQGILVTAADTTITNPEIREGGATMQFVDFLTFHTGAARGKVRGFRFAGQAGDAGQSALQVTAAVDGCRFEDIWITGTLAAGCVETTAAATNILIQNVYSENAHATQDGGVVLAATTTGLVNNVIHKSATHDADGFNKGVVAAGAAVFNAYVCNLAGERGGAWGTASTA